MAGDECQFVEHFRRFSYRSRMNPFEAGGAIAIIKGVLETGREKSIWSLLLQLI